MYREHYLFPTPPEETVIWRYMPPKRFVDVLNQQALWFARPDTFEDKWEGALPLPKTLQSDDVDAAEIKHASNRRRFFQSQNHLVGVNCWHMSPDENVAMWKIYGRGSDGVAIRSTFTRLRDSFVRFPRHHVYIGKVNYIDYRFDPIPGEVHFQLLLNKRRPYADERELRAMTLPYGSFEVLPNPPKEGWHIPIELSTLIESVYLAPGTTPSLRSEVERAISIASLHNVQVIDSEIDSDPAEYFANIHDGEGN